MPDRCFETLCTSGFARRGRLHLAHGTVETPVFMPVGTYGAVKTLDPETLEALGTQVLLGNTYHLYLRPGTPTLDAMGGLHRFMGWDKPILTDSGGFQVFSLANNRKIDEHGVTFRSPLNGDRIELTPELCAKIQQSIGSDIAMVLDECPALPNTDAAIRNAVDRSHRWAERFFKVPRLEGQKIFAIVQGGTNLELRLDSLRKTLELPLDGLAIGGLSVGEGFQSMVEVLEGLASHLPAELPHYLMGVGTPLDLLESVHRGMDLFDCVLPTRNARNGAVFTDSGLLNLRNAQYRTDPDPIASGCECPTCLRFSRAYLRHLFSIKEILGCRLATIHNLHYYHRLMAAVRKALEQGTYQEFYSELQPKLLEAYGPKPSGGSLGS